MEVVNLLDANAEEVALLQKTGTDGPIYLVNLFKFREIADYGDKTYAEISGKEAYHKYASAIKELLPKFGGKVVFSGNVEGLWVGLVGELWDEITVVMYPSRDQVFAMGATKEWQEASIHRAAGLEGQLNIETTSSDLF